MADKKISALTSASTPLAGTEVLPIVQSGSTVKVAISDVTAGREVSASKFIPTGNVVTGNGMYLPSANKLAWSTNGVQNMSLDAADGVLISTTTAAAGAAGMAVQNTQVSTNYFSFAVTGTTFNVGGVGGGESLLLASNSGPMSLATYTTNPIKFITNLSERARIFSSGGVSIGDTTDPGAGNLRLGTGNLVQGTAAKGVNFTANTPAAGMTSQLLNWYEEGTWTPDQGSGLVVVGAFSSSGKYTRIGRQVTISASVQGATTIACTSAGLICTNLPFTVGTASSGSATTGNANQSSTLLVASTVVFCSSAINATAGGIIFSSTYFV
jgi:hypothetical protein